MRGSSGWRFGGRGLTGSQRGRLSWRGVAVLPITDADVNNWLPQGFAQRPHPLALLPAEPATAAAPAPTQATTQVTAAPRRPRRWAQGGGGGVTVPREPPPGEAGPPDPHPPNCTVRQRGARHLEWEGGRGHRARGEAHCPAAREPLTADPNHRPQQSPPPPTPGQPAPRGDGGESRGPERGPARGSGTQGLGGGKGRVRFPSQRLALRDRNHQNAPPRPSGGGARGPGGDSAEPASPPSLPPPPPRPQPLGGPRPARETAVLHLPGGAATPRGGTPQPRRAEPRARRPRSAARSLPHCPLPAGGSALAPWAATKRRRPGMRRGGSLP